VVNTVILKWIVQAWQTERNDKKRRAKELEKTRKAYIAWEDNDTSTSSSS